MSDIEKTDAVKKECLKEIWKSDKLGRSADADYLIRFLTRRMEESSKGEKSYVLNIDASWGGGKSFFLERLGQQLEMENHLVTHVNAWADDHIEDPQIAVMAAIEVKIEATLMKDDPLRKDWKEVKRHALPIAGALVAATETVIGNPLRKGRKTFDRMMKNSITAIDIVVQEKSAVKNFKKVFSEFLGKLNKSRNLPFFILIDEMDRCRPPYAIALLERVKHLFDIDNVVFVFATDTEQLSHSIGAVYGADFASHKYLQRFFDQTYLFEVPQLGRFIEYLVQKYQLEDADIIWFGANKAISYHLTSCFHVFGLDLRAVEQCIGILRNVVSAWSYDAVKIKGLVLLPMIIAHHQKWEEIENSTENLLKRYAKDDKKFRNWRFKFSDRQVSWLSILQTYQVALSDWADGALKAKRANYNKRIRDEPENLDAAMYCVVSDQIIGESEFSEGHATLKGTLMLSIYSKIVRSAGRFAQP